MGWDKVAAQGKCLCLLAPRQQGLRQSHHPPCSWLTLRPLQTHLRCPAGGPTGGDTIAGIPALPLTCCVTLCQSLVFWARARLSGAWEDLGRCQRMKPPRQPQQPCGLGLKQDLEALAPRFSLCRLRCPDIWGVGVGGLELRHGPLPTLPAVLSLARLGLGNAVLGS